MTAAIGSGSGSGCGGGAFVFLNFEKMESVSSNSNFSSVSNDSISCSSSTTFVMFENETDFFGGRLSSFVTPIHCWAFLMSSGFSCTSSRSRAANSWAISRDISSPIGLSSGTPLEKLTSDGFFRVRNASISACFSRSWRSNSLARSFCMSSARYTNSIFFFLGGICGGIWNVRSTCTNSRMMCLFASPSDAFSLMGAAALC